MTMGDLILHHYANSPFSEKVRLVLGLKGLSWRSVTVPVMMPKPDVLALTGGYRRTPFMQIGADIYCDSALMCRVIDRLAPQPPLYPHSCGGMAPVMAQWADSALFWVAVPLTIQLGGPTGILPQATPEFLKAFAADRAAMTAGVRRPGAHDARAQLAQYLAWLEQQLGDGRSFMLGHEACIADFSVAQSLWFMQLAPKVAAQLLQPWPLLRSWHARVTAFGHGTSSELSSSDALQTARHAAGHAACAVDATLGFDAGTEVTMNALDYGADPVAGRLVGLSMDEVVLERHDERAGLVHVHFPRIGFQIRTEHR
jgi:glutathione S-transferase